MVYGLREREERDERRKTEKDDRMIPDPAKGYVFETIIMHLTLSANKIAIIIT